VRRAVSLLALSLLAACGGGSGASTTAPGDGPPASGLSLPPVAGAPSPPAAKPGHLRLGPDWPTYHHENSRGGYVGAGPDPQAPAVAWQAALDGKVYASPLVVGGRVLAATEAGSLYSLDGATGRVLWRRHLADPIPAASQPCGNIDPLGVTGTPVYDPASHQVFAVTTEAGSRHVLFAVDAATGRVRSQRAVDAPGSVPATQLQRGALLLAGHTVYIAYGGNLGDCGAYHGRVVAVPVAGGALRSFAVPTGREAGIWAASGPAATPAGEVLVTTGNGAAAGGDWDHSDSVLRLSPALALQDGFAPQGWAQENSVDADLGSTGPVLLPGGTQALAAGKGGSAYLVDIGHLGGVGGERVAARLLLVRRRGGGPGDRWWCGGLPALQRRLAAGAGAGRPAVTRLAGAGPGHRLARRGRPHGVVRAAGWRPVRAGRRNRPAAGAGAGGGRQPLRDARGQR